MAERDRLLRWLQLRSWGWQPEHIAAAEDVDLASLVEHLAPFEPVTLQQDRTPVNAERAALWARRRHLGEPVTRIAATDHVHHWSVSVQTRSLGPFPAPVRPSEVPPEVITRWVARRRAGESFAAIAASAEVPEGRVARVLAPLGPFPPRRVAPPGLVGIADIVRCYGTSEPTVAAWVDHPDFPAPVHVRLRGQRRDRLWDLDAVRRWGAQHLTACPDCSARAKSLSRHRGARHKPSAADPSI